MSGSYCASLGWAVLLGAVLLLEACASSGAVPHPFPTPGGVAARVTRPPPGAVPADDEPGRTAGGLPGAVGTGAGEKWNAVALTGTALALRGAPYRNGGTTPAGFDCSGFVQYVFARHGLALPRETREQFRVGSRVRKNKLQPGDLLFFSTVAPGASHVGIAIDADQFVHAPSERGVVRVEQLSAEYWRRRFIGARRPERQ